MSEPRVYRKLISVGIVNIWNNDIFLAAPTRLVVYTALARVLVYYKSIAPISRGAYIKKETIIFIQSSYEPCLIIPATPVPTPIRSAQQQHNKKNRGPVL